MQSFQGLPLQVPLPKDSASLPYESALYIGYERSVIAVLEESFYELLDALRDATYTNTFEDFTDSFKDWWDQLVNPMDKDSL